MKKSALKVMLGSVAVATTGLVGMTVGNAQAASVPIHQLQLVDDTDMTVPQVQPADWHGGYNWNYAYNRYNYNYAYNRYNYNWNYAYNRYNYNWNYAYNRYNYNYAYNYHRWY